MGGLAGGSWLGYEHTSRWAVAGLGRRCEGAGGGGLWPWRVMNLGVNEGHLVLLFRPCTSTM